MRRITSSRDICEGGDESYCFSCCFRCTICLYFKNKNENKKATLVFILYLERVCVIFFLPNRCLQGLNKIRWFVVWLCLFGFIEGAAVNGLVNIILTTLETRFNLPSSQSGLIVSATDIGKQWKVHRAVEYVIAINWCYI